LRLAQRHLTIGGSACEFALHEIVNDPTDLLRIDKAFSACVWQTLRAVREGFVHAE